ncbi:MAG: glycosyltransferase [Parvibaculaceae bacterium]
MTDQQAHKIAFIISAPSALRAFMAPHVAALAETLSVTVYCNFATDDFSDLIPGHIRLVHVPFERKIDPLADIRSFAALFFHLRREGYDAVHSLLPKAGLLGMMAAFLARVPVRIHTFTGQIWATKRGVKRAILKSADRLIASLTTHVFTDSPSQSAFLREQGVCVDANVLGDGSVAGVDQSRFFPQPDTGLRQRREIGIADDAVVFGFLGRLTRDKGLLDLAEAFATADLPGDAVLLLVGPDEENIVETIRSRYSGLGDRLHVLDFTRHPELVLNAFDVFCLPSYREGFGTSVIEAAACAVPTIASRIYGLTDAVEDGVTGLLHPPADVAAIRLLLEQIGADPKLRDQLGQAALARTSALFSQSRVVEEMKGFYRDLWPRA